MENKVPDLSKMSSISLEMEAVIMNGQKLLFDKKVKLMPVELEQNQQKDL